ncbi:DUF6431 domain-containing protein [Anaeromicropila populeti]|uniref:DUF6431 domain-containing protein n=1 Tax=Anaeromicropila populeti TaxID=37658 RepID=A0A1I6J099_9FIRM|nr:DUF6431 domain-containing protein [Anaeromicropila populeti]SFR72348.1 hypothetical protein SAMN05661086_01307 [Anaeromicropila populeti]
MIIDFSTDSKQYKKNILDFRGIWNCQCPTCGTSHSLRRHGTYKRNVVTVQNGCIYEEKRTLLRLKCISCGHTHAILPVDIIPFRIYTASAVMALCTSIYVFKKPVLTVSNETSVSFPLLYLFLRLFHSFLPRILLSCHNFLRPSYKSSAIELLQMLYCTYSFSDFLICYLETYKMPIFYTHRSGIYCMISIRF